MYFIIIEILMNNFKNRGFWLEKKQNNKVKFKT